MGVDGFWFSSLTIMGEVETLEDMREILHRNHWNDLAWNCPLIDITYC